jgi:16S rRNA processing protein RimM
VRVRPAGRFPQRFRELRQVYLGERYEPATILHRRIYRSGNQDGVVLRLDLLRDREVARERIGQYVYVPESDAVPLPPGEYFVHQIVGLAVRTVAGEDLGKVVEVLQTGSNDVYVVRGRRGEVLLPATREVIKEVDLEGGTLRVEPLPGLIDEPPPPAESPPTGPPPTGPPPTGPPDSSP